MEWLGCIGLHGVPTGVHAKAFDRSRTNPCFQGAGLFDRLWQQLWPGL